MSHLLWSKKGRQSSIILEKCRPQTAFHKGMTVSKLKSLWRSLSSSSNIKRKSSKTEWPKKHTVFLWSKSSWTLRGCNIISGQVLAGAGDGKTPYETNIWRNIAGKHTLRDSRICRYSLLVFAGFVVLCGWMRLLLLFVDVLGSSPFYVLKIDQ